MTTLFDLTYQTASLLGVVQESAATGGSTTTTVDTVERLEADDYWNKGTLWILKTTDGLAPQGEFARISDFVSTTHTLTHGTLTAAPGAGDIYAVCKARFPLSLLKQKVNEALRKVGKIPVVDTSLTTASEQTEYTLPLAAYDLREVWLQTVKDTNDRRWKKLHEWRIQKGASGVESLLLTGQYESGYLLKLVYAAPHATLFNASDVLDESISPERIVYDAAVGCLLWRKQKSGNADSGLSEQINYFQDLAEQKKIQYPVMVPARTSRLMLVGD